MNADTLTLLVDLIDLARLAATGGVQAIDRFDAHRDAVRRMIADGRGPSAVERQALADDLEALRNRLHGP